MLSHLVNLRIRRRVHLVQVHEAPRVDLDARAALPARLRRDAGFAVDGLGEDPRERGLAYATRAREEIRMMQALGIERVCERFDDMLLADQLLEDPRAPLSRQYLVSHWLDSSFSMNGDRRFGMASLNPGT